MEPEKVAVGIRAARPTESEVIAEIHERTAHVAYAHVFPGQPFPRDETIRRWQSFEGQIVVAEQAGKIVGFAAFDSVELHALYVLPAYQDQGIGRLLLQAAGAVAQLWVSKENRAARRFYEMCGWSMDGDERLSYGVVEVLYRRHGSTAFSCSPPLQASSRYDQACGQTEYGLSIASINTAAFGRACKQTIQGVPPLRHFYQKHARKSDSGLLAYGTINRKKR
jgi:GNAT superfamily N-acetyltransferase